MFWKLGGHNNQISATQKISRTIYDEKYGKSHGADHIGGSARARIHKVGDELGFGFDENTKHGSPHSQNTTSKLPVRENIEKYKVKKYECKKCDYSTTNNDNFINHVLSHGN